MASGTITGSTNNEYIDAKVVWSSTANKTANTSTVKAALYYKRNNTGFQTYGSGSFSITINGKTTKATKYITITQSEWVLACEATVTVSHNGDGSKSITISATGSLTGTTFTSTLTSTTLSGTAKLDLIARASTISSVPNYEVTLGETYAYSDGMNVVWTPLNASFRYKLKFSMGDWSSTTSVIHPNSTSAYEFTVFLPLEAATVIPNATLGTMTVTLYTYSNSAGTTQVGSASSKTFTVKVPNNDSTKPTATMTLAPVSALASPFDTLYIKGRTKVDANFTNGEGKFGADIVSYKMSVDGKSYGSPYTSGYLATSGDIKVTGTITDSRGFSRTYTTTIKVLAYESPKILPASNSSEIICARCDENGNLSASGTYLKVKARRSYSTVTSSGAQKNYCEIRIRYRAETSTSFSNWETILERTTLASDTADTNPMADIVSSAETAYVVQVGVVDDLGESAMVQFLIPADFATIDIPEDGKGRRIGFGRYAGDQDGIYIGLPIFGAYADFVTEVGAWNIDNNDPDKGYWQYKKWSGGNYDMSAEIKITPKESNPFSSGAAYYSEQILVDLPFAVETIQYVGVPSTQGLWLMDAELVDANKIGFRLAGFETIKPSEVVIRLLAQGKTKNT